MQKIQAGCLVLGDFTHHHIGDIAHGSTTDAGEGESDEQQDWIGGEGHQQEPDDNSQRQGDGASLSADQIWQIPCDEEGAKVADLMG
ncbi:hypothetical protein DSECCO2_614270 [anaerobic digester metagenome]